MADTAARQFSDEERESFYYELLNDLRFEGVMLHEPLWTLNGRYPTAKPHERHELAETTLLALLDKGLIEVFRLGDKRPFSLEEARSVILGNAWRTVPVAEMFELDTTPEGDAAHDLVADSTWDRVFPARARRGANRGDA